MDGFEQGEPAVIVHEGVGVVNPTREQCEVTSVGKQRITVRMDNGDLRQFNVRDGVEWGHGDSWWPPRLQKVTS